MAAIGMVAALAGYGLASWGYMLLRDRDVKLSAWLNPLSPYTGPWPPGKIPPSQVLP